MDNIFNSIIYLYQVSDHPFVSATFITYGCLLPQWNTHLRYSYQLLRCHYLLSRLLIANLSVTPISHYCFFTTPYLLRLLLTDTTFSHLHQLFLPIPVNTFLYFYQSSNINEVIRAVLNLLLFFYKKFLHAQKSTKTIGSTKKAQKRNQAKAQNANEQTKIKNVPKKHLRAKSNLFAYFRFCVFCMREEKKIKNKKMKSSTIEMY